MKKNHIVLIGFKHVGKSTIGKMLAEKLSFPLVDLDREIEKHHKETGDAALSCREIYSKIGREAFRDLEHTLLGNVLSRKDLAVISLGGGTAVDVRNQDILRGSTVILITSPKEAVYERIMLSGKPAFLSPDENAYDSFSRVWDERERIYKNLATITVENNDSVERSVQIITEKLKAAS